MDTITTFSATRQPPMIVGPTVTLVYTDERISNTEEDGIISTVYQYTQYRFDRGEYELVQVGSLPSGAEWDDVLRGIERATLYDEADRMINKYSTDVPDDAKRNAWIAYKHAVRETQGAEGYPLTAEYPDRPERGGRKMTQIDLYDKDQIDAKMAEKADTADLATVAETGSYQDLVDKPDLTGLVPSTRKVNDKPLSSDITLTASDVGALPADGTAAKATADASGNNIADTYATKTAVPSAYQAALVSGTNIKTVNGTSLLGSGDITISTVSSVEWGDISGTLADQTDLATALSGKQDTLVSGTNIKTVNGSSLLGSGDLEIGGGEAWVISDITDSYPTFTRGGVTKTTAQFGEYVYNNYQTKAIYVVYIGIQDDPDDPEPTGEVAADILSLDYVHKVVQDGVDAYEVRFVESATRVEYIYYITLRGSRAYLGVGNLQTKLTFDSAPTSASTNPVTSGGVYTALDGKVSANAAVSGATRCKITYDSKGLVTGGSDLVASDIPDLSATYIGRSEATGTIAAANPVALKDYVDGAINASTAVFLGTYDAHDDLGLTVVDETDPTNAEIAAAIGTEITFPTGFPSNNDYIFIQLDYGATGNVNEYRRFKYRGATWAYEYTVNSSTFTEMQWAAINSGVTAAKVTAYDGYASGKQDTLTFDSAPTLNSTNPVTSGGVYNALANVGGMYGYTVSIDSGLDLAWTNSCPVNDTILMASPSQPGVYLSDQATTGCKINGATGPGTLSIVSNADLGTVSAFDGLVKALVEGTVTTVTADDLDGATSIGSYAFAFCNSLTSVTIPDSVTSIGYQAFNESSLTSVTMPDSVTSIGSYAFQNCSGLTSVTIPSSVTSIGDEAFYGCSNLTTVTVQPTTPPTMSYGVFPSNVTTIYVPSASLSAYQSASGWSECASKMVGV